MKDYLISSVIRSIAKLIIWIVEDSGELMKASLKYAVNKVFQHDEYQSCWAETLPFVKGEFRVQNKLDSNKRA